MAAKSPARQKLVSTVAAIEKHNGPSDSRLPGLRRDLAAEALAEHIQRVVDNMPLTDEQLTRLTVLMHGGG